jgi:hypothetical protein
MTFDPKRRLVMASFKTVLGHSLPASTPLVIVDEPSARGEVDEAMARRLYAGGLAVYAEDHRPTPVETPDEEKARLAAEALREAGPAGDGLTPTDDLVVHPDDHPKAGKKVTKDDLLEIAENEGVTVETDDNKPDLQRKIMEARAATALNGTNAGSDTTGGQGDTGTQGNGTAGADGGADNATDGDAHGLAGEGQSDTE